MIFQIFLEHYTFMLVSLFIRSGMSSELFKEHLSLYLYKTGLFSVAKDFGCCSEVPGPSLKSSA